MIGDLPRLWNKLCVVWGVKMSNDGCPMPDEAEVDPIVLGPIGLGLGSAKADIEEVSFS